MKSPSRIELKNELITEFSNGNKKREVGRYSVSQIYAILEGWISPEQYIEGETMDFPQMFNCWYGAGKHKQIEPLLKAKGYETEIKKEYDLGDFKIVGICDFMKDDMVGDLKTSLEPIGEAKKWSLFQVKIYCSVFEKATGIIYEPMLVKEQVYNRMGYPKTQVKDFYLKEIGKVERNDTWFKNKMGELREFHNKMLLLVAKDTKTSQRGKQSDKTTLQLTNQLTSPTN